MVTLNLEENEISFLLACLEELCGLVSSPPMLLNQLHSKLAYHSNRRQKYNFSVGYDSEEQVSSLIFGHYDLLISCYRTMQAISMGMTGVVKI
jgi:hypothetical protein